MLSLQNRIALILVASIMAVLILGTVMTFVVVTRADPDVTLEPVAEFMSTLARIDQMPTESPQGILLPKATERLHAELEKLGVRGNAIVVEAEQTQRRVAAIELWNGRWATFDVSSLPDPPRSVAWALTAWVGIIFVGASSVALFLARRVTEPFAIIERAVASVGPSGELPHVPVGGSTEARRMQTTINTLAARVNSAMRSRIRLVAAAGHDLRTPMTRMRLRAELLPDEDQDPWLDDLDELEAIASSAISLVREESGAVDQTDVEISELVRETVAELSAANLAANLGTIERGWVKAGPLSLRRALRNLITNAATYGGGAVVSVHQAGETILVRIDDNGPGIPEDKLARVLEPFFRADEARSGSKGAGLGLTIANEIIERLGGSLTLENRVGGGFSQIVALPLSQPHAISG